MRQRTFKARKCIDCPEVFVPTGNNTQRCVPCRKANHLKVCKERWKRTYVKKGRADQTGSRNPGWKGGTSPAYYRKVGFEAHGKTCACGREAVLIHHKDEDRTNSSPDNLEPLCKRCHQLHHNCAANLPQRKT